MTDEVFDMPTSCLTGSVTDDCISNGHKVILKKDRFYKIVTVEPDKLVLCEKSKIRLNGAVGKPYESQFLIEGQNLVHIANHNQQFDNLHNNGPQDDLTKKANAKDNRHLSANPDNQSLKPEDITQLRAEGKSGAEIIDQLVENSASFQEKTVFSQAKYLKKKKKKHMETVTILRPTTRNLCEFYSVRGIQKILGLRVDTVSFILSHANVHSGANVLMHETCAGLLMGAALERLGTEGCLMHFHHSAAPLRPESHAALPEEALKLISDIPLQEATALRLTCNLAIHADSSESKKRKIESKSDPSRSANGEQMDVGAEEGDEVRKQEEAKKDGEGGSDTEGNDVENGSGLKRRRTALSAEEADRRRLERRQRLVIAHTKLLYEPWNALIVASKFDPSAITLTLLHFLCPGAPFVVYCQRMQPLIELLNLLKKRGEVVMVELTEGWLRPYQVLPERTHPEMTLNGGGGGYVLTGYKACGPFGKSRTAESDYEDGVLLTT